MLAPIAQLSPFSPYTGRRCRQADEGKSLADQPTISSVHFWFSQSDLV